MIANNTVDGAAVGVSVCNFNEGGRIAVVQGNIIRNLLPKRPIGTAPDDDAGIGIYVEADSSVTGNVVEKGDSLSKIAKKFYGDMNAWKRIFEANRDRIHNPDLIQPGWKLRIPE